MYKFVLHIQLVHNPLGWVRGNSKAFVIRKFVSFDGHTHDASSISGILSIEHGGTGVSDQTVGK